jgi:hypothetical protein
MRMVRLEVSAKGGVTEGGDGDAYGRVECSVEGALPSGALPCTPLPARVVMLPEASMLRRR